MPTTPRPMESVREPRVYVAFELSLRDWKLALTSGFDVAPLLVTVPSRDLAAVQEAVAAARVRFGLAPAAPVVSCFEAGRDGFWIHRALQAAGISNRVVDSSSIEVNRRARRAKTDRLDALKLVRMLVRVCYGEQGVWREVRVPSAAVEAARHVSRERTTLVAERTRLVNQLRSWLATWGAVLPRHRRAAWWTTVRDWAGAALPAEVQARIARAEARLALIATQVATVEATQQAAVRTAPDAHALERLVRLRGVGTTSASTLVAEGLVWRQFTNRRQVGGCLGFTPTPYQSGAAAHDQGISGAGNRRLQATCIQLAWTWIRWQPFSPLTQWYRRRFGHGTRPRRIGIVAVARRLLIALWRYVSTGVAPEAALLQAA